jgi:hypothetical protein
MLGAAQPILAAVDQHSTAAAVHHDGGMHPMEMRFRLNVSPRAEKCQTHVEECSQSVIT